MSVHHIMRQQAGAQRFIAAWRIEEEGSSYAATRSTHFASEGKAKEYENNLIERYPSATITRIK